MKIATETAYAHYRMCCFKIDFNCRQQEREKYNKMVEKYERDLSETHAALYEEGQSRNKLQMELDAKDSEIELLQQKLSTHSMDTASVHSGSLEDSDLHNSSLSSTGEGDALVWDEYL